MLKHLVVLLMCLVAGAAVSTLFAMGCARYSELGEWGLEEWEGRTGLPVAEFWKTTRDETSCTIVSKSVAHGMGVEFQLNRRIDGAVGLCCGNDYGTFVSCRAGWPFKSMRSRGYLCSFTPQVAMAMMSEEDRESTRQTCTWAVGAAPGAPRVVPTRVEWSGLLANSACFGLLPLAVWRGGAGAWRRLRITRGQCAGCGYDTRGLGMCPECRRTCH
jgi:hypothetical protein